MKQKRWSKAGRELREKNPGLFTGGGGKLPHMKGGPHRRDIDYKRSDRKREQNDAMRGDYD